MAKRKSRPYKSTVKSKGKVIKIDPAKKAPSASEPQAAYAVKGKEKVIIFLGISGRKTFSHGSDESYLIDLIRKGLPKRSIDEIMAKTGLNEDEIASILHISRRTLQRRNPTDPLNPEQSERLIELAKLYTRGQEVFGNLAGFNEWMDRKVWTLGAKKPKDYLDTSMGINLLMDELGRIEHGVYS